MRVAVYLCARQPRAVDQAGVVERVRKNRVAGAHQRRHDADVGGVARIKIQRARQAHKGRQFALQRRVGRAVAADQRRSAGPHAIRLRAFTGRLHQGRVRGQAQVVVAAKGQHALPVHRQASAAFRNDHAALRRRWRRPVRPRAPEIHRARTPSSCSLPFEGEIKSDRARVGHGLPGDGGQQWRMQVFAGRRCCPPAPAWRGRHGWPPSRPA
jgi:hypothetical protein